MNNFIDWDIIVDQLKDGEVRTIGIDFYQNNHGEFDEIIKSFLFFIISDYFQ